MFFYGRTTAIQPARTYVLSQCFKYNNVIIEYSFKDIIFLQLYFLWGKSLRKCNRGVTELGRIALPQR